MIPNVGISDPRSITAPEAEEDNHAPGEYEDMPTLISARTREQYVVVDDDLDIPPFTTRIVRARSNHSSSNTIIMDDRTLWFEPSINTGLEAPEGPTFADLTQILLNMTLMKQSHYLKKML